MSDTASAIPRLQRSGSIPCHRPRSSTSRFRSTEKREVHACRCQSASQLKQAWRLGHEPLPEKVRLVSATSKEQLFGALDTPEAEAECWCWPDERERKTPGNLPAVHAVPALHAVLVDFQREGCRHDHHSFQRSPETARQCTSMSTNPKGKATHGRPSPGQGTGLRPAVCSLGWTNERIGKKRQLLHVFHVLTFPTI